MTNTKTNNVPQFSPARLRALMNKRGLLPRYLAAAMIRVMPDGQTVDAQAIRCWLWKDNVPGANKLSALATALNCKIEDLYE